MWQHGVFVSPLLQTIIAGAAKIRLTNWRRFRFAPLYNHGKVFDHPVECSSPWLTFARLNFPVTLLTLVLFTASRGFRHLSRGFHEWRGGRWKQIRRR